MGVGRLPEGFTLLQVTPGLDLGGVEQATVDLATAVARAGGRSLVASRGGALEGALAAGGGALVRLPVQSKNPLVISANAVRLERLIRREPVSLVHVRSRAPAFSALWAARAAGVPVVASYHGLYPARTPIKRWYNGVMTRGDRVIANSAFTRDHIIAAHRLEESRIAIIPEGVDTARFDPESVSAERIAKLRAAWGTPPDGPPVILVAARMTALKGQTVLVEALGRLGTRAEARLILAGEGEGSAYAGRVLAAAAAAGVADQVRLVGPCADMPAAFALADLVAAPSLVAESFGRSLVEAAAMERPVIASALGGPCETVVHGETGWLVRPGDVDAWRAALEVALSTPAETLAAIGRAGRERALRLYGLESMCEATFSLYRRLIEARP